MNRVFLSQSGRLRLQLIDVWLVCIEEATFNQGTNSLTDRNQIFSRRLFRKRGIKLSAKTPFKTEFEFALPVGAMHSFKSSSNRITWQIEIHGQTKGFPKVRRVFEVIRHSKYRAKRTPSPDDRSTILMSRPRIEISLDRNINRFQPGDVLVATYELDVSREQIVSALETSVIWLTTGKGDEDYGVHFFERRPKSTLSRDKLKRPHRISTVLPPSPLSYEGEIIRLYWCVRIRVFYGDQQFTEDLPFQLGNTSTQYYEKIGM